MASLRSYLLVLLGLALLKLGAGALTSTGQTLLLNDVAYYVPVSPIATVPMLGFVKALASAAGLVPVTVVGASTFNDSLNDIASIIEGFGVDDVWSEAFLEGKPFGKQPGSFRLTPAFWTVRFALSGFTSLFNVGIAYSFGHKFYICKDGSVLNILWHLPLAPNQ